MFWHYAQRYARLLAGLYLYGLGLALMVYAEIGVPPWDVLATGIAKQTHISYGWASVTVSALVLLTWIPLRVKPGVGTIANGLLIGIFSDTVFPWLPQLSSYWQQLGAFLLGLAIVGLATGFYISSKLGTGPRDGMMIGLQKVLKRPFWQVRTLVEVLVMTIGWLLGGQVREGTLIFAVGIGYLTQVSFRIFGLKMANHKRSDALDAKPQSSASKEPAQNASSRSTHND